MTKQNVKKLKGSEHVLNARYVAHFKKTGLQGACQIATFMFLIKYGECLDP